MPIDAVPNDLEFLRALVNQLSSERDAAIAESRRLTEQNDQLRHLLKQLQVRNSASGPNGLIAIRCNWRWKISRPRSRHETRKRKNTKTMQPTT